MTVVPGSTPHIPQLPAGCKFVTRCTERFEPCESIEPPLSDVALDRITRLLVVLISQSSLRTWRDHLGVSADQAAEDVDWVLRAVIAAARSEEAR